MKRKIRHLLSKKVWQERLARLEDEREALIEERDEVRAYIYALETSGEISSEEADELQDYAHSWGCIF